VVRCRCVGSFGRQMLLVPLRTSLSRLIAQINKEVDLGVEAELEVFYIDTGVLCVCVCVCVCVCACVYAYMICICIYICGATCVSVCLCLCLYRYTIFKCACVCVCLCVCVSVCARTACHEVPHAAMTMRLHRLIRARNGSPCCNAAQAVAAQAALQRSPAVLKRSPGRVAI
jgi:hypothetical protein